MITHVKNNGSHSFTWIDVVDPNEAELNTLAQEYHLHPATVQDCLQPDHLPKYELIDETHFMITRYYDMAASKDADDIQQISRKLSIFCNTKFIITVHRQKFGPYEDLKEKYANSTVPLFDILCKIIKCTLGTYEDPVEKLDKDIDFYESRVFLKKRIPDLLKSLYAIKRRIYIIRKLVNLSEEAVNHIGETRKKTPAHQDLKDYYLRLDTQIEEVYDSIQSLLTIYISLASQRTNDVMRTLTVFTAFFLPLTFIVGVYGMNFKYMPELEQPMGYPATLGVMLVITIVIYAWFKRKGWM